MSSVRPLLAAALILPTLGWAVAASAAAPATVVRVTVDNTGSRESMKLDKATIPAGPVQFVVVNNSFDEEHEMIVARTDLVPARFPTTADGSRVLEDKFTGLEEVGEIKPHEEGKLAMSLQPGHYILFCNIKNHFKNGMYAELDVTQ
jgi:uncharacterized cupredoxin-like copper-binding protein